MTSSLTRLAVLVVRAWTRAYTWRLPPAARDARRAEIDSDLWELQQDRRGMRRLHPAAHIAARWLLGIPDDLAWRTAHRSSTRTRRLAFTIATVAIAAIVAVAIWMLPLLRPAPHPTPPRLMRFAAAPPPPTIPAAP